MGSGGGGVERATVVNVDGQAKSFLAASPENERQACQAGLTPSDGGRAWVPPSAAVAVTCRALRCPSKNGMRLRRLHQQYKSMPAPAWAIQHVSGPHRDSTKTARHGGKKNLPCECRRARPRAGATASLQWLLDLRSACISIIQGRSR